MTYRLGIDIGSSQTVWATVARDGAQAQTVDGGTVESVVALTGGRLVAGADVTNADPSTLEHVTRDFAQHLGDAAPMMIGGTPYGVESLVGQLVA